MVFLCVLLRTNQNKKYMHTFTELGLNTTIVEALSAIQITEPTDVQIQTIPEILGANDVLCIANTGTGKTLCYVLPLLQILETHKEIINRQPPILVLTPTRELALQVTEVFKSIIQNLLFEMKTLAVHGGSSINIQMKNLMNVEILIATPGRLLDLLKAKSLKLDNVQHLVIDEADKMLNLGFKEEMQSILKLMPHKKQTILLSATLAQEVNNIANLVLNKPKTIEIKTEETNLDLINQSAYEVATERKGPMLRYLIKTMEMKQVLVFTNSVHRADAVVEKLIQNGIQAEALHSKRSQGGRTLTLTDFKSGKLDVVVATDLASRGIDIAFLPFVINYELPRSPKDYIHRIGRTGRAQNAGTAISLISEDEKHHFNVIQKKIKKQINLNAITEINLQGY
jgi:ATP-dependent RNA helicase RhlE